MMNSTTRLIRRGVSRVLLLSGLLLLTACGGGGGGSDSGGSTSTANANGIWNGTFRDSGVTYDVSAMLYNGDIIAISSSGGTIYVGSYTVSGNELSGRVTVIEDGGGAIGTADLSATVSTQSSISGTFTTSYGTSGTASLSFDSIYNRTSSLAKVAGIWTFTDGAYSLTVTVDPDGSFFGQDTSGCTLSGALSIIDPNHNLYRLSQSISGCGVLNGSYSGYAGLLDTLSQNDTLQVAVLSQSYILIYPFARQ